MQKHLVEKPQDLGQVQPDEIKIKEQGKSVWMAIAVKSRLWLGGVVREHGDLALIVALLTIHWLALLLWAAPFTSVPMVLQPI